MPRPKLIFLISQPRSGSSMVQQMIMAHQSVSSLPEPWIMLPLVYTYKDSKIQGSFNSSLSAQNINRDLNNSIDGKPKYHKLVREFALEFYNIINNGQIETPYFLDKTPRYYHIVDELEDIFPDAKFIYLTRNPLSVFTSALSYNYKGDIERFLSSKDRQDDILKAPKIIAEAISNPTNNKCFVKYEDFVLNPKNEIGKIYEFLELSTESTSLKYKFNDQFKNHSSKDTKSLHKHDEPVKDYLDSWKPVVVNAKVKSLVIQYLERLGPEVFSKLGYSLDDTIKKVKTHKVKFSFFKPNFEDLIK